MRFTDYQKLIDANGTHNITITLIDKEDASEKYKINVTFYKEREIVDKNPTVFNKKLDKKPLKNNETFTWKI